MITHQSKRNFLVLVMIDICIFKQEQTLDDLGKNLDKATDVQSFEYKSPPHLHTLLSALHKHLLAFCYNRSSDHQVVCT